jgi:hypothetical protein
LGWAASGAIKPNLWEYILAAEFGSKWLCRWVAGMSLVVTFNVRDLSTQLGGGPTPSNQWEWQGPSKAEIPTGGIADRHWNADLTVEPISECDRQLRDLHGLMKINKQLAARELEELSAAQTNGTADATIVWKYKEATLGITIGLRPQRYELFRTFVTLHFHYPGLRGVRGVIGKWADNSELR